MLFNTVMFNSRQKQQLLRKKCLFHQFTKRTRTWSDIEQSDMKLSREYGKKLLVAGTNARQDQISSTNTSPIDYFPPFRPPHPGINLKSSRAFFRFSDMNTAGANRIINRYFNVWMLAIFTSFIMKKKISFPTKNSRYDQGSKSIQSTSFPGSYLFCEKELCLQLVTWPRKQWNRGEGRS